MQKGMVILGLLIITLFSVSFVSADLASSQLCIAAGQGPACLSDAPDFVLPEPVAEDSDTIDTSDTQKIAGANFNFLSNLYQGKIYTKEELVAFGKAISERADVKQAIANADEHCKNTRVAICSNWMDANTCSNYQNSMEEGRLADCDYVQVTNAAKAAYESSLTPLNPEGSIEAQRCHAGIAFDGSECDSSTEVILNDDSTSKESALNAAIEATKKDQQETSEESALTAAIEAAAEDRISKEFPTEDVLGDIMLDVGIASTVEELVNWKPIPDRLLAYAKMKSLEEQKMCAQSIESHCETAKEYLDAVDKLTQAKAEQDKKTNGKIITVRDRLGRIVLQFRLMIQNLFGRGLKGSSYTPAP